MWTHASLHPHCPTWEDRGNLGASHLSGATDVTHRDSWVREAGQFVISSGRGGGHARCINKSKGSATEEHALGSRLGPQVWSLPHYRDEKKQRPMG